MYTTRVSQSRTWVVFVMYLRIRCSSHVLAHTLLENLHISKDSAQQLMHFVGEAIRSHWKAVKKSSGKPPTALVTPSGLQVPHEQGGNAQDTFEKARSQTIAGGADEL